MTSGDPGAEVARAPYPAMVAMARRLSGLPTGPLGEALRGLTPVQRAIVLAEILGPPVVLK